ncbi:outer membrane beta-barrel protein [Tenacibaculum finnmarkense]|uniref:TonB-dependent receptor n=1 Tax=Tenacibaculum finnmarkense genomovar finnmarkense TaxID=1458503 RepID=A0AAP1RH27_9FLAO|nr:outer membrane beta-barrel protein [Tenacibaculum finnmarkense]MBE7653882.1 TonB-dependent receptor [Tenacibaculum finnmarkense genomovar finnmarkense]MBE7696185.1 TonB-dependent receptor [Tenacibaculum finnmarkense genomovar finnmarkense]MCD8428401.1 TonB-dependent receptor [Tenacibaculum finnmarkense genomovar finnmarkense]MCG8732173.1 TonB-dependent receptor [Tenacibaculum finnmarkense]MCG8752740.1 TonB-dependent receptor [Tenacibaculum finnmarkense]
MKKKITLLLFILFVSQLFSQHKIKGKVTNILQEPMIFVNTILLEEDNLKLVKGEISDEKGFFLLNNIKKGTYLLKISLIGYKEIQKQITILNEDIDLGLIHLQEELYELETVHIKAKKQIIEQKIDRLTVNVEGTLIGNSGSALDILERLPGVEVSSDGGSLTLNGKSEVGVLINDKLTRIPISSLLKILSSTSAKNIKNIDLITNPSAKYDAEFTGGLININHSKVTTEGVNGSLLLGFGYGRGDKESIGGSLSIRKSKVNFHGNASFDRNDNPRTYINSSTIRDGINQIYTQNRSDRSPIITGYNAQLGLDYYINENVILGGMLSGNRSLYNQNVIANGASFFNNQEVERFKFLNSENSRRDLMIGNLNLELKLDTLSTLDFNLNFLNYYNENPTDYDTTVTNSQSNITSKEFFTASKNTPVNIWVGKIDYSKKITNKLNLEFGSKLTNSELDNTVTVQDLVTDTFIINEKLSEKSNLLENIWAFYSSLDWKINEKTNINIGLRYEYSNQKIEIESNGKVLDSNLSKLFPTIFMSRKLGDRSLFQVSYGRRISRPTYFDLAPFLLFLDPNTFFQGNINLKPSISNTITSNYKYKKYLASFQFTNEDNAIVRKQTVFTNGTKQQTITTLNLDFLNTYSLNLVAPIKVTPWWKMENTFQLTYIEQEFEGKKSNDDYFSVRTSQNFNISDDIEIQLFANYNSERLSGTTKIDNFQRINIAIEKKIERWNSKIQLSFNNIFEKKLNLITNQNMNTSLLEYRYEPRILKITFTHDFGHSKVKKRNKKKTGIKEIKQRIN